MALQQGWPDYHLKTVRRLRLHLLHTNVILELVFRQFRIDRFQCALEVQATSHLARHDLPQTAILQSANSLRVSLKLLTMQSRELRKKSGAFVGSLSKWALFDTW